MGYKIPEKFSLNRKLKLLYLVTEDWYFVSHRLPLAVAAQAAGFDVAVATREGRQADVIRSAGIRLIPFSQSRRSGNPLREVTALWRLYRREQPDLVHHVALKPVMFGTLAVWLARVPAQVNAVAGLGWLFTTSSGIVRLVRPVLRWMLARLLNRPYCLTIVQNPEDRSLLERSGVPAASLRLIRGAGVNVQVFHPVRPPPEPVCIVLVSRMLWDKGVGEFVEAARRLTGAGVNARFVLVGNPDPANPASVPESSLRSWHGQNGVEWWGRREDMPAILQAAHIACLPSAYGEGLPKSLLEAAACGLPIVTTDAPGCREVVRDGVNGLLVPVRDVTALAAALGKLIGDPLLRRRMGEQSRLRAESEFAQEAIIAQTLAVYREVCA
ncbi:MAG: glycosyl transferase family 1 [Thiobacillus sp. SCN 63-57]|uniref:glycosyltransferase family 4 protein n=1 Tax=Thiobacillus sp. SCN 63-57 TaxID=1660145 RepID=UPI000869FE93|nr:glycosyltransferase family 4 protein [Thiobacillus sp. SCN 63-57]ODU99663.1 MAG: glycosyl transferase family 1 [Thiobacillus sp. SCN 63-57]